MRGPPVVDRADRSGAVANRRIVVGSDTMSAPRWIAAVALTACLACRGRDAPTKTTATGDAGAPARDAAVAGVVDAGAAAPITDDVGAVRREGEALLARWVDVQNKGDVAGYQALYEPKHFKGIKRT